MGVSMNKQVQTVQHKPLNEETNGSTCLDDEESADDSLGLQTNANTCLN